MKLSPLKKGIKKYFLLFFSSTIFFLKKYRYNVESRKVNILKGFSFKKKNLFKDIFYSNPAKKNLNLITIK